MVIGEDLMCFAGQNETFFSFFNKAGRYSVRFGDLVDMKALESVILLMS